MRWLLRPKLHVIVLFMIQFMVLIVLLGGVVPELHKRGVSTPLLVIGAILVMLLLHVVLGALGKLVPVRCRECGEASRYEGFGWWPFRYRYTCTRCSHTMGFEVGG